MTFSVLSFMAMNLTFMSLRRDVDFSPRATALITDIMTASETFKIPAELILAVMYSESEFDPKADSGVATGYMQLHKDFSHSFSLDFQKEYGVMLPKHQIVHYNVVLGSYYLRKLWDRFGDIRAALAAYHAGPGNYTANKIGPRTRRYVRKVMACVQWPRFSREVYPLFLRHLTDGRVSVDKGYELAWGSKYPAKRDPKLNFYF